MVFKSRGFHCIIGGYLPSIFNIKQFEETFLLLRANIIRIGIEATITCWMMGIEGSRSAQFTQNK